MTTAEPVLRPADLTPLPRAFYARPVETVAREVLGALLIRTDARRVTIGRIVESEAYLCENDPACHAARGRTPRTEVMFGEAGYAYVYAIHAKWCLNVVTQRLGEGCAVLLRAVEPLVGLRWMRERRSRTKPLELARGPARLCAAFAIDRALNGWDLTGGEQLWLARDPRPCASTQERIEVGPRVGVTSAHALPLRFSFADNRFVSLPRRVRPPH